MPTCPVCHQNVSPEAYFCPNCGTALKEKPPSTSILNQIGIYAISIFLPPFGYWYAYKYLKFRDRKSFAVGLAAVVLTTASLVISVWLTDKVMISVNKEVNQTFGSLNLNGLSGF